MTCFTNLDYKYVHISFIAPIHCFSPRVSLGHEESCPILFKTLSVQGEVSFVSSHRKNQGPKGHCYDCSLLSQGVAIEARAHRRCCYPGGWDALHGLGAGLQLFLVYFPTLSHHCPKHGPRGVEAGWEG